MEGRKKKVLRTQDIENTKYFNFNNIHLSPTTTQCIFTLNYPSRSLTVHSLPKSVSLSLSSTIKHNHFSIVFIKFGVEFKEDN